MRRTTFASAPLLVFSLLALPAIAHAQCPNVVGASADLDAQDAAARVRFVRESLSDDAANARLWTWGWVGVGATTVAVNGVWAGLADYDTRVDRIGAATGGAMMALTTLIDPMSVTDDASAVDAAASAPARPGVDPCVAVASAEKSLAHAAQDETSRQSLVSHAIPIGGAVAVGLVLGLGYGHWTGGALSAGIGVVLTELKMLTQPQGSVRALDRYRTGVLGKEGPAVGWTVVPVVSEKGGGLTLSVVY